MPVLPKHTATSVPMNGIPLLRTRILLLAAILPPLQAVQRVAGFPALQAARLPALQVARFPVLRILQLSVRLVALQVVQQTLKQPRQRFFNLVFLFPLRQTLPLVLL